MALGFSSYRAFNAALGAAQSVDLAAYTLGDGDTERALVAAANHGVRVRVRLSGTVFGDADGAFAAHNAHEVQNLTSHGIDAALTAGEATHLKAAVVDGHVFLDDRNWCGNGDLLVSSDVPEDIASATAALAGRPTLPTADGLAFAKGAALADESALLRAASGDVDLQTETLGACTVTAALQAAAACGNVRVLLTRPREALGIRAAKVIAQLEAHGVAIRMTSDNHKFFVSDSLAWAGSANASGGNPNMSDWGAPISDAASIAHLRTLFDRLWSHSKIVAT